MDGTEPTPPFHGHGDSPEDQLLFDQVTRRLSSVLVNRIPGWRLEQKLEAIEGDRKEPHRDKVIDVARVDSTETLAAAQRPDGGRTSGDETAVTRVPRQPRSGEPAVTVVIPALNEARNLPHVLSRLPEVHEVILVDGGSVDDTVVVARRIRPDIRIVTQNRHGKGNALACGFAVATGDIIITVDASGSTDPSEIPAFVSALLAGADYVKGSRFMPGGGSSDITLIRRFENMLLSTLANVLYRTRYSDLCYGYNAFWTRILPLFQLDYTGSGAKRRGRVPGDGFEIETLLNLRVARADLVIAEVASFEHPRIHGSSNFRVMLDGLRALRTIASEWRRRPLTVPSLAVRTSGQTPDGGG